MEHARKYFAQAMKLNSNNMRALFGFYLVSRKIKHIHLLYIVGIFPGWKFS